MPLCSPSRGRSRSAFQDHKQTKSFKDPSVRRNSDHRRFQVLCGGADLLRGNPHTCSEMAQIDKARLKFGREGEGSLLVLTLPVEAALDDVQEVLALPLISRKDGMLLVLPRDAVKVSGSLAPEWRGRCFWPIHYVEVWNAGRG